MSTSQPRAIIIILLLVFLSTTICSFVSPLVVSIPAKDYHTYTTAKYGTFYVSFEALNGCRLALGYIPDDSASSLTSAPYTSTKFIILAKMSKYSNQIVLSSSQPMRIILFNEEPSYTCTASVTIDRKDLDLSKSDIYTTIPYGEYAFLSSPKRAGGQGALNVFYVRSESDYPMPITYSTDDKKESIILPPNGNVTIGNKTYGGPTGCTVTCDYPGNCPIYAKYIYYSELNMNFASIGIIISCLMILFLNL